MKHLPKHLRPRWRYLGVAVETWPGAALARDAFQRALWDAARSLLGDPGSADADCRVVRFRREGPEAEAIVRVRRDEVDAARAALACVDAVDGDEVGVRVRGVSGTVRACEERYLGRAGGPSEEKHVLVADERRPAHRRSGVVDVELPAGFLGGTERDFQFE